MPRSEKRRAAAYDAQLRWLATQAYLHTARQRYMAQHILACGGRGGAPLPCLPRDYAAAQPRKGRRGQ